MSRRRKVKEKLSFKNMKELESSNLPIRQIDMIEMYAASVVTICITAMSSVGPVSRKVVCIMLLNANAKRTPNFSFVSLMR